MSRDVHDVAPEAVVLTACVCVGLLTSDNGSLAHGVLRFAIGVNTWCAYYSVQENSFIGPTVVAGVLHELLNVHQHDVVRAATVVAGVATFGLATGRVNETPASSVARNVALAGLALAGGDRVRMKWPVLDCVALMLTAWPCAGGDVVAPSGWFADEHAAQCARLMLLWCVLWGEKDKARPVHRVAYAVAAHPVVAIPMALHQFWAAWWSECATDSPPPRTPIQV